SCSFYRRRRIDCNHVELFGRGLEVPPTTKNHNVRQWCLQKPVAIRVIIREHAWNAGHQLDGGGWNTPGEQGTKRCSHAKANRQSILRRMIQRGHWQMGHHFSDW